jgi:hypothetical protein
MAVKELTLPSPAIAAWDAPQVSEAQEVWCELSGSDDPRLNPLLVMQVGSFQLQMGLAPDRLRELGQWLIDASREMH